LISKYFDCPLNESEINSAYAPREAKIFMCGEDTRLRDPYVVTLLPGQENFIRSYGVSCNPGMSDNNAKFEGFGGQMATGEPIPWALIRNTLCVKQSQLRASAETILAFDMPNKINNLGGFFAYAGRPYDQIVSFTGFADLGRKGIHGKRFNYAFCDGHVEPLEPIQTVRPNSGAWYYDYNYMWTRNPEGLKKLYLYPCPDLIPFS
jgi:prepilin-type processing-associated H-X9-DG protein